MQGTWLINLVGLFVASTNLGTALDSISASKDVQATSSPYRSKRHSLGLSFPYFQSNLPLANARELGTQTITTYVTQQPGLFPFSFPFNWHFPLVLPATSNPFFNTTQVVKNPQAVTTPTALNNIGTLDARKDSWNCGKSYLYLQATTRIVDGDPAQYGEFPWLVAVMRENGRTHLCGGSLVSNRYVLSAAHCFASYNVSDVSKLRVYIGDYNIYDPNDVRNQVRSVTRLIRHSKWNNPANFNDIALLKLDTPVEFNNYVQPICLARGTEASFYSSGTVATVAGWGKVQWGYPELQRTPQKIAIPLVDRRTCQRSIYPHAIADSMICAGSGFKSTCLGDSGGAMFVLSNDNERWYQVGIVSWGLNCNGYGVFTRVSSFSSWIDKYMKT